MVTVKVVVTGSGTSQPASTINEQLSREVFICLSSVLRLSTKKKSTTDKSAGAVQMRNRPAFESKLLRLTVADASDPRRETVTRG